MTDTADQHRIGLGRWFTIEGVHPDDELEWERRKVSIVNAIDGSTVFEQNGVEFPVEWSETASKIVTQKYFRGQLGTDEREWSLRQVIDRVVDSISSWGQSSNYFADADELSAFRAELTWMLLNQRGAFNSPVWFNLGVENVPQQSSACFILSVEDNMESILNWYVEEGRIFKGGSGAGVNLSRIRSTKETMAGGGSPSGPVSFMRGADASAGTIKSGGKTRRAAKMVVLDVDHPDVEEFIWCKAREEDKARALAAAGFDVAFDGKDSHSLQYQNANNSVRLSDDFMKAAISGADWNLLSRTTGKVVAKASARDLLRQISEAAWECADPGVQFSTTINRWHTSPSAGSINASNPCSEYLHLDNSACNLASLNLLSFLGDDDEFDVEGFRSAVQVFITAQEILVSHSSYPTEKIGRNTRRFRQLGLGYTNLGALLMALGIAYDSDEGRALAAALTSIMCGEAYRTSAMIAARLGAFDGFEQDRTAMIDVLKRHRDAAYQTDLLSVDAELATAARKVWDEAVELALEHGVRNSQVTVLAPTGTISFMMDCDTTGIEPDFSLIKFKQLAGGGHLSIVNHTVGRALNRLGYAPSKAAAILEYVEQNATVVGAPEFDPEDESVFACSVGDNSISADGHIAMMAAVQPFLSGGISKTVNLPETATVEDIEDLLIDAWKTGVKAVAVYRDNCKVGQPLSSGSGEDQNEEATEEQSTSTVALAVAGQELEVQTQVVPERKRLPRSRRGRTFEFRVADCKGFVTIGEYEDGRPGEIFVRVSKQGSTLAGIMDAFAISLSHGLQYGVPLSAFVRAFVGMRFEPAGMTDDEEVRIANSLMDYLFRRLAIDYLDYDERAELGIFTTGERLQPTLPGVEEQTIPTSMGIDLAQQHRNVDNVREIDSKEHSEGSARVLSLFDVVEDDPSEDTGAETGEQKSFGRDEKPEIAEVSPIAPVENPASAPQITPAAKNSGPMGFAADANAPMCMDCGTIMVRAGSCYVCQSCGATSGCS